MYTMYHLIYHRQFLKGMLAWIPVYPFDVVKTSLQNKRGDDGESVTKNNNYFLLVCVIFLIILIVSAISQVGLLDMAKFLQRTYGFGVFYDGITPKVSFIQLYWTSFSLTLSWG
jgi:Mitochondrial carrier protein